MMRLRILLVAALTLFAPSASRADSAAPGDSDLPNDPALAPLVPLGTYNGTIGAHDYQDWILVTHAADKVLRVVMTATPQGAFGQPAMDTWNPDGTVAHRGDPVLVYGPGGEQQIIRHAYAPAGMLIRVVSSPDGPNLAYTLDVAAVDAPDLAVWGIEVRHVDKLDHVVNLTIANNGTLAAEGRFSLYARGDGVTRQSILVLNVTLQPGQTLTLAVPWRAVGAGDVDVHASARLAGTLDPRAGIEMDHRNNYAYLPHTLLVDGRIFGVIVGV